jgi:predicted phage terminase large subunit-like protein
LVKRANDGTGEVVLRRGSTYDNKANLAPFLSSIVKRYENTRLGRQELEAELLEDAEGSLWNRDMIEAARIQPSAMWQEIKRVVVALDVAASVGEDSDETGIIVAGLGYDDKAYVLEDISGKYSPIEWATKAVGACRRHRADRVVAETNMGGQMVEATIRAVDPNVPYKGVHAKRGKLIRAEPISALYEQHHVHHVGMFSELEDQLTGWQPGSSDSPDRLDALVYAITDLMIAP